MLLINKIKRNLTNSISSNINLVKKKEKINLKKYVATKYKIIFTTHDFTTHTGQITDWYLEDANWKYHDSLARVANLLRDKYFIISKGESNYIYTYDQLKSLEINVVATQKLLLRETMDTYLKGDKTLTDIELDEAVLEVKECSV